MPLTGKVALITGGGSGLGRAMSRVFAERGSTIVVMGRRRQPLEETLAATRTDGSRGLALVCDVTSSAQVNAAVAETVSCFGRIDILINNAGHSGRSPIEVCSDADWALMMATHLGGAFFCSRAVTPVMKKQRSGKIICMSSIRGQTGGAERVAYSTAKAGLLGFTKALALELAPFKVNVNAIAPAFVETEIHNGSSAAEIAAKIKPIPWGRGGKPEEVAYLAAFLASAEADFITGQVLAINGGKYIAGI